MINIPQQTISTIKRNKLNFINIYSYYYIIIIRVVFVCSRGGGVVLREGAGDAGGGRRRREGSGVANVYLMDFKSNNNAHLTINNEINFTDYCLFSPLPLPASLCRPSVH